jgi:hypothetical protein
MFVKKHRFNKIIALKLIIFSSIILYSTNTYSQKNLVFSGDTVAFPIELSGYMSNLQGQNVDKVELFIAGWGKDSLFTLEEQVEIIKLSRLLVSKNIKPPYFLNFLSCLLAFKEFNSDPKNYDNWYDGLTEFADRKKTTTSQINNILEFTDILLRQNLLYQSSSVSWKATNPNFKILNHGDLRVEFGEGNLVCYSKGDSIVLYNTKGMVYPAENIWKGQGGLVTWEKGGYPREEVFANIKNYEINLTKSEYTAEDVVFTNKRYFTEPLKGILNDQVRLIKDPEDATFPRFDSYTKQFFMKNIYEDIDYEGGLSMQGAKLVGTGSRENLARLKIYKNDTLILIASSVYYGFRNDRIASQHTTVTIKLDKDSIYHPDLFLTYRVKNRELTLLKSENYSSQGPYSDSYHKVDMNFDQLTWRMNENYMKFTAPRGAAIGNAYFESVNFFNYDKFMAMMMLDKAHPLVSLKTFSQKYGSEEFPVEDFANYLNMDINQVQQLAMRMAYNGFVFYDKNIDMITIKPRLYDYLAASINKIDYDVIGFSSVVDAPLENAIFELGSNNLTINGIPQIYVSDSQDVIIYPRNNQIVLKDNRNFQFNGKVEAGLLTFYGDNFFFNYDTFKINLQNVDSLHLRYLSDTKDNFGFPLEKDVNNLLHSITGELLIDKPDNKSGRESYPEYPIFISKENSYVYYEKSYIQNGVYESNDFYFQVYPFIMDSLDNFNYRDLLFKGQFVSADIFPTFEKQLTLQTDNSLGFRHMTPAEGYPVYKGKGTFYNEIWLSNKGLKGDGKLEYITSTTLSKDFNFYPDSMNTTSDNYDIAQKTTETEYPMVRSVHNYIHWLPYADKMYAHRTDVDFTMFNDSTHLTGNLLLEPFGLSGKGRMDLKNSDLQSDLFAYKAYDIFSDTADFYLKSLNKEGFTVLTDNINAHINYTQKMGWFHSNEGYSLVNFPDNRYISYLDDFTWDMEKKELVMGKGIEPVEVDYTDEDSEPEGPRFISVHPAQDSLSFIAPLAYYDYKHNFIKAKGVKFIEVADSRIYPNEGKVTVEPEAKITTLEKAKIRTNKLTKFHTIHTATLKIISKNYFEGMGNYDYIDENEEVQNIHFKEIKVDSTLQTVAMGEIYESANFKLSPVYKYQGKVFLESRQPLLSYKGGVRIEHNCENLLPDWLFFQSRIDPKSIFIPVDDQPVNYDRSKIYAGIYVHYDSIHVFPAFFTAHKGYSDKAIVNSSGFLYYDRSNQLYKIGSREKIDSFSLPDNYLSLFREECKIYGEGNINLGQDLGQVKLQSYGNAKHDIEANETTLDLVMSVDFFMSSPMIEYMAKEIDSIPNLEAVDLNRILIRKYLDNTLGAIDAQKLRDELLLFAEVRDMPHQIKHTFVFNELKLIWNNETNSYRSVGKIGIASIDNVQINKKLNGFMELQLKRSGDNFDIYLDLGNRNYYYFGYTRGVMQTLSSNNKYVETIMNIKAKDRKQKVGRNETSYIYLISTDRKKDVFRRKYLDSLEGIVNTEEGGPLPEP